MPAGGRVLDNFFEIRHRLKRQRNKKKELNAGETLREADQNKAAAPFC